MSYIRNGILVPQNHAELMAHFKGSIFPGFGDNLHFKWETMGQAELRARKSAIEPIRQGVGSLQMMDFRYDSYKLILAALMEGFSTALILNKICS